MRIEFKGQISDKVQIDRLNILKPMLRFIFFALPFVFALFIFLITLPISFQIFLDLRGEIIVYALGSFICGIVNEKIPQKVSLRVRICPHIVITEEEISSEEGYGNDKKWRKKKTAKVKKVLDHGDVFYIYFKNFDYYIGDVTGAWICQKDKIVDGTIEEFEEFFKNFIVRKYNNSNKDSSDQCQ